MLTNLNKKNFNINKFFNIHQLTKAFCHRPKHPADISHKYIGILIQIRVNALVYIYDFYYFCTFRNALLYEA